MSIPQGGPIAKAAFLALLGVHFFAQTLLMGQIASLCPSLGFNQRLNEASVAQCLGTKTIIWYKQPIAAPSIWK
ncbi:MAG: hypothetical protein ACI8Z0_001967 [Lentimonas sp.]